jgi:hypothetical protein|tara:strand:+ start:458 stop:631 length:174 start_codon:yes stop_codon:yes gene_type:complete
MLDALTLVTVGKTEWWLVNVTPASANAVKFGIKRALTCAGWSPSNTKTNMEDMILSL